jgi:dTDP-4-amino-4,6-dideoxygalactose transaminase
LWCKRVNPIPPLDLTQQFKSIGDEVNIAVLAVLASAQYINGPIVEGFEQQFAQYIGTDACVSCNSGTDALYLALRSLQIGSGDEVITTPFTFFSSAEVISAVGATPVFVDIDPQTFNLDLSQVEAAITDRTKAILPVHLFGQPLDMTWLMSIADRHGLWVVEDCAQAAGAEWSGAKVGSIGHIGCFSFYPTKNLGACGDGGAVTTNDLAIAQTIRALRTHGERQRYIHEDIGLTSRLDAVQAAVLQVKLRYLDDWNWQRQQVAARYEQMLKPMPGVVTPQAIAGGRAVWHQYTIRLTDAQSSQKSSQNGSAAGGLHDLLAAPHRDRVRQQLQQQGVNSMIYYPLPLHLQPVYAGLGYQSGQFPVVEQISHQVLSLPMFPELTVEQQERVVYALKDCLIQAVASF